MSALFDLIAGRLKDIGARAVFGVPGGGGNLDLIEAAGRVDLPFVLTAAETAGALAAVAHAEVTGRPGACLTTLGPGAASAANGVACAFLDRAPILIFTDSQAGAGAFEHQRFDHQAFFRPITKWSGRLASECAYQTLEQAFASLLDLPPGPVHIDCPPDVEPARALAAQPRRPPMSPRSTADDRSRLAALAAAARRPLIVVGLGARSLDDAAAILTLVERRGVPAMVTYKAKGVVPDDHPCFAGVFTNARIEQPIVDESDLIVGIGLDPVELLPRPWTHRQPVASIGRWRMADGHLPFAVQLVTDVPAGVEEVDELLPPSEWDLDRVRAQVDEQRRGIDIPAHGMTAQRVVRAAAERLAHDARVTVDAGAHMFAATLLWPAREPNQMLISNGLSTMGFALPAAIGAALADPARPVVALTGDGGLLMCAAELLTAVREKLRIIVIVFSDASLSLIEVKQRRQRYRPAGVALGSVSWPTLAGSFGMPAFRAASEAELGKALDEASHSEGPSLIEARIDRSNYARTLEVVRG